RGGHFAYGPDHPAGGAGGLESGSAWCTYDSLVFKQGLPDRYGHLGLVISSQCSQDGCINYPDQGVFFVIVMTTRAAWIDIWFFSCCCRLAVCLCQRSRQMNECPRSFELVLFHSLPQLLSAWHCLCPLDSSIHDDDHETCDTACLQGCVYCFFSREYGKKSSIFPS
ncbi:unnamed protein product, partial [Discosporangium mesarthrocarpum]